MSVQVCRRRWQGHPRVAVIVPVFNKAPYLQECLESISAQSLAELEVVCVDDASTDGSLDTLAQHARSDDRFTVLANGTNLGPGSARNIGLGVAAAPFVQFTDADDLLPVDALRTLLEVVTVDDVALARGSLVTLSGEREAWSDSVDTMQERRRFRFTDEPKLWIPYFHVCYVFARAFLQEHGITYPHLRNGEDPVFLANCLVRATLMSVTAAPTYFYRRVTRPSPTSASALDYLTQVASVRDIYIGSSYDRCWHERASGFYLEDTRRLLRQVSLSEEELLQVQEAMSRIWPDMRGIAAETLANQ